MTKPKETGTIEVPRLETQTIQLCILGESPMILNRMSEKAKHDLLFPKGKKTSSEKAVSMKHNPMQEFQDSPHRLRDENAPTLLAMPSTAFKGATATAALRVPGAKKTEIGQLVFVKGEYTPIYGLPQMFFAIVRSADMAKTPDVRMRSIIREWAAILSIEYISPNLNATTVTNLVEAAGKVVGVGDWRPEKGKGDYGRWRVVNEGDKDFLALVKRGGRKAQEAAMAKPTAYDADTEELLAWFNAEMKTRGRAAA